MDQDKQTLLEAAKAATSSHDSYVACHVALRNLRAAIAREEAKPSPDARIDYEHGRGNFWRAKEAEAVDRAQQAEADAKWHREESERLSVHLTRMIAERDHLQSRVDDTDGRIAAMEIHGNSADHWYRKATAYKDAFRVRDEAVKRAEMAESESARLSADLAKEREACAAPYFDVRKRAEKAEAEVARMGEKLARLVELQVNPPIAVMQPFEGDPQTCAFGSNAFRGNREVAEPDDDDDEPVDPMTGWTFATYRRVVEALGGKS